MNELNILKKEISMILNDFGYFDFYIKLFGSRARGDYKIDSDYDILIVLKESINLKDSYKLKKIIRKKIAHIFIENNIICAIDVLIKSSSEIEYFMDKIGSITKEAINEGILL